MKKWLLCIVLLVAVFVAAGTRARAADTGNVTVCNDFPHQIYFAVAYNEDGVWNTSGWWGINPNQCRGFRVLHKQFWWHFETNPYPDANGKSVWSHWGHDKMLFVSREGAFHFVHAEREQGYCALRGFSPSATKVGDGYLYDRITVTAKAVVQNIPDGTYEPADDAPPARDAPPLSAPQSSSSGPDFE